MKKQRADKHSNKIARTSVLQEMRPNLHVASVSCGGRKLFLVAARMEKMNTRSFGSKTFKLIQPIQALMNSRTAQTVEDVEAN